MKTQNPFLLRVCFLLFACGLSAVLWAQESGENSSGSSSSSTTTSVHTSSGSTVWYTQPWVWIIGGAVFILLLVALLNSGKSRDTVTSERTTVRETKS